MPLVDNQDGAEIINGQIAREARVYLFDPPKGGKTPVDGAGQLCKSPIRRADVAEKIKQGFTLEPVGHEPPAAVEAEVHEKPVRKRAAK